MNHINYSDQEYHEIAQSVQTLIEEGEKLDHAYSKELLFAILQHLDQLHREALGRLMRMIESNYPKLQEEMESDFAVQGLFALYDLMVDGLISRKEGPIDVNAMLHENNILTKIRMPVWIPACNINDVQPGVPLVKEFEGIKILLCRVNDELFAVENKCLDSVLTMEFGKVEEYNLICPWHACKYDLRTGELAGRPGKKIKTFPIQIDEDGKMKVGFNI